MPFVQILKPLCIIPARGGSKRFPRKNIALLAGKPLLGWAIESAKESEVFDMIMVSSEDEEILSIGSEFGADLTVKRPAHLADDKTQLKTVCKYHLENFTAEGKIYKEFALLLTTNPLKSAFDIRRAYEIFAQSDANYLMSLVQYNHPPQRAVMINQGYVQPYFGIENMKQAQRLQPLYHHDGSFIYARTESFLHEGEFYGSEVLPYIIPGERSVDIDSPLDLKWAEFLLNNRYNDE